MGDWKDSIRMEIAKGGTESPCPFCKLPRVKRSDYTRCPRCAVNWMDGESLDHDPRSERMKKFLASTAATSKNKKSE